MSRPGSRSASIAACLVGFACRQTGEAPLEPVTIRDGAGVRIVENHVAIDELPEWRLTAEPRVRIGTLDGAPEYQFSGIAAAARLSDGRLAVLNSGTSEVRMFDPPGRFLLSFGSEGEGPEEFEAAAGLWSLAGDSLLVYDDRGQRLSSWTRDGECERLRILELEADAILGVERDELDVEHFVDYEILRGQASGAG